MAIADAYKNASHHSARLMLLSAVAADFSSRTLRLYFLNLTEWQIRQARNHAHFSG